MEFGDAKFSHTESDIPSPPRPPKIENTTQAQGSFQYQATPSEEGSFAQAVYGSCGAAMGVYDPSCAPNTGRGLDANWKEDQARPFMLMLPPEHQVSLSGTISYEFNAAGQVVSRKSSMEAYPACPWPTDMGALGRAGHVLNGSEIGTDLSSPSPTSLFSELSDHDASSADTKLDRPSPSGTWTGSETTPYPLLEQISSYDNTTSFPRINQASPHSTQGAGDPGINLVGLSGWGIGVPVPNFHQNRTHGLPDMHHLQMGSSAWTQNEWMGVQSGAGVRLPMTQARQSWASVGEFIRQPTTGHPQAVAAQNHFSQDRQGAALSYTSSASNKSSGHGRTNGHSTDPFEGDMQMTIRATGVRKKEDQILLDGKRAGLTYKEIRTQMHTNVAESTLRGRYRSLTKARKDRVRKPVWTENDLRLLRNIVRHELGKLDEGSYQQLSPDQRLAKVPWKKVAEYIAKNGGSYHFGNSTCKKKWGEMMDAMQG